MDFRSSNLGSNSNGSFKHMTWHLRLYFPCTKQLNLRGFHHGPFAIDKNLNAAGVMTFFIVNVYSIRLVKYASILANVF